MVNCNPETVSTDYDTSDRLYFEPLTLEDVLEIVHVEKPKGLIVQFGGQTPLKLAVPLHELGVPIFGTTPDAIDRAEDRERFAALIDKLKLRQPHQRHGPQRRGGLRGGPADRLPGDGAPLLRAGRPGHGGRLRRQGPGALPARGGAGVQRAPGAGRPVPARRDRGGRGRGLGRPRGGHRRGDGAHRGGRHPLRRLGLLAAAALAARRDRGRDRAPVRSPWPGSWA